MLEVYLNMKVVLSRILIVEMIVIVTDFNILLKNSS